MDVELAPHFKIKTIDEEAKSSKVQPAVKAKLAAIPRHQAGVEVGMWWHLVVNKQLKPVKVCYIMLRQEGTQRQRHH